MTEQVIRPEPFQKIFMDKFDPDYHADMDKDETKKETKKLQSRLADLQEILYAQSKYSVLIVLQAMDAGGKDSTIKKVFSGVNPQGFDIASFKKPSEEELAHDFLW